MLAQLEELDVSVSEWLNPTNYMVAKEQFLEGARCLGQMTHGASSMTPTRPSFEYGKLDREQIKQNLERCRRLNRDVVHLEYGADERRLLVWLSNDMYYKWRLLEAASDLDHFEELDNTISRQSVEDRFRRYNAKVYGEPDKQTFFSLLNYQLTSLPEIEESDDWKVRLDLELRLADLELLEGCDLHLASETLLPFVPMNSTVNAFAMLLKMWQRPLLKHLRERKEVYSADEVAELLARILDQDYPESEFQAMVDSDRASFSVDQQTRQIKVPAKRAKGPFTFEVLQSLVLGHEWAHIARSLPYEKALIPMLGTGMPGYLEFEEGVTSCLEKALNGKRGAQALAGLDHYVNIGLATFGQRNFREVFEIRWRLLYLAETDRPLTRRERREKAEELAFSQTMRAFRGTGYLPNYKDLVYYNGSVKVWQYIQQMGGNYEGLMRDLFEMGKTDITNEQHLLALELEKKWQAAEAAEAAKAAKATEAVDCPGSTGRNI